MNKKKYQEYLESKHWKKLRAKRVRMDGGACTNCGSRYQLQVHHRSYQNIWIAEKEINDITTLCSICHHKEHFNTDDKPKLKVAKNKLHKYHDYQILLTDTEVAEIKSVVNESMKYNNIIQPFALIKLFGRSEDYVTQWIIKMKESGVLVKMIPGYVANPYIFNKCKCDKDFMQHIKNHFDSDSVYNTYQMQLIKKQLLE